jgi:hypothetical protein
VIKVTICLERSTGARGLNYRKTAGLARGIAIFANEGFQARPRLILFNTSSYTCGYPSDTGRGCFVHH